MKKIIVLIVVILLLLSGKSFSSVLVNHDFSKGFSGWEITGDCQKSLVVDVPHFKRSIKFTCVAQSFTIKQSTTNLVGSSGSLYVLANVKANESGVVFSSLINDTVESSVDISKGTKLKPYSIPSTINSTSNGVQISASSFTGEVIIDDVSVDLVSTTLLGKLNPVTNSKVIEGITVDATTTAPTKGTTTVDRIIYSRSGDKIIARYDFKQTTAGSAGNGDYLWRLPDGLKFDSSKVTFYTGSVGNELAVIGNGVYSFGTQGGVTIMVIPYDETSVRLLYKYESQNAVYVSSGSSNFSGSDRTFSFEFEAEIEGWTSGLDAAVQNSNDTLHRAGQITLELFDYAETHDMLKADGRCVLESDYPDYKKNIGDSYGDCTISVASDGMRLPDLRGYFPRFLDDMGTAEGAAGIDIDGTARTVGQTQQDEIKSHNHKVFTSTGAVSGTGRAENQSNSTASSYNTENTGGTETRSKNIAFMPYVRMKNVSYVIAGTFENINSSDLIYAEMRNNSNEAITTTTNIPWIEVSDVFNVWDGDEFTAPKNGEFTFEGSVRLDASNTLAIDYFKAPFSTGIYAKEGRCSTQTATSVVKINCTVKLVVGDKIAFRPTVNDSLSNSSGSLFHRLTITQSSDYESIVKNLYNEKKECQTKYLASDFSTSDSSIPDIRFNNLTIGNKYYVKGMLSSSNTTQNKIRNDNTGTSDINLIGFSQNSTGGFQTQHFDTGCFVAVNTSVRFSNEFTTTTFGNGTKAETWAELCELPPSTICNSNKWD